MALSQSDIKEAILTPKQKNAIGKATKHEQRLKFHSEEVIQRIDASPYLTDFLVWIRTLVSNDKAQAFENMLNFPLYTNGLLKSISEELNKVYEAENSSFNYEFTDPNLKDDFQTYLHDIDFWEEWKTLSGEAMVKNINSILVVDMPAQSDVTAPYYYFLDISTIKDIDVTKKGAINWLISKVDNETYFVLDELSYRYVDKDGNLKAAGNLPAEAFHNLGYCPACFFWSDTLNRSQPIVKKSPVSSSLNNLDELLKTETNRRCAEMYAAFPILSTYQAKCNYSTFIEEQEVFCKGGLIDLGELRTIPCPVCSQSKFNGPGTLIEVPMPMPSATGQTYPDLVDSVKIYPAETKSLDYLTGRVGELWDEVFYDSVGSDSSVMDKQAINKDQVKAHFSSPENILYSIRDNLQASHKFVVDTMARLIYDTSFISSSINYGTDFYLQSSSDVIAEYTEAKKAGVPNYYLNYKRDKIDSITTRGNEIDTQRLIILRNLEPWLDLSADEVRELEIDTSNPDLFFLKADFSRLIKKFENEYGSIVNFGSALNFNIKIDKIQAQLLKYVNIDFEKIAPATVPPVVKQVKPIIS